MVGSPSSGQINSPQAPGAGPKSLWDFSITSSQTSPSQAAPSFSQEKLRSHPEQGSCLWCGISCSGHQHGHHHMPQQCPHPGQQQGRQQRPQQSLWGLPTQPLHPAMGLVWNPGSRHSSRRGIHSHLALTAGPAHTGEEPEKLNWFKTQGTGLTQPTQAGAVMNPDRFTSKCETWEKGSKGSSNPQSTEKRKNLPFCSVGFGANSKCCKYLWDSTTLIPHLSTLVASALVWS